MALLQSRFEMNPLVSSAIKIAALSGPQKHHLRSLGPEAPEATDFEAQLSPLTNDLNPYRRIRGEHRENGVSVQKLTKMSVTFAHSKPP
jgi:hypothetical protein